MTTTGAEGEQPAIPSSILNRLVDTWIKYEQARGLQVNEGNKKQIEERLSEQFSTRYRSQIQTMIGVLSQEDMRKITNETELANKEHNKNQAILGLIHEIQNDVLMDQALAEFRATEAIETLSEARKEELTSAALTDLYQRMEEEAQRAQVEEAHQAIADAQEQYQHAQQELRDHQDVAQTNIDEHEATQKDISALTQEASELNEKESEQQAQVTKLQSQVEGLKPQISQLEERINALDSDISGLEIKVEAGQEEANTLEPLVSDYDDKKEQHDELTNTNEAALKDFQKAEQDYETAEKALQEKQEAYGETPDEQQQAELNALQQDLDKAAENLKEKYTAYDKSGDDLTEAKKALREAEVKLDMKGGYVDCKQKVNDHQANEKDLTEKRAEKAQLSENKQSLEAQYAELNQKLQSGEVNLTEIQSKLKDVKHKLGVEQKVEGIQKQRRALDAQITGKLKERESVAQEKVDLQEKIATLVAKPDKTEAEQQELSQHKTQVEEKQAKIDSLNADIAGLRANKDELQQQVIQAREQTPEKPTVSEAKPDTAEAKTAESKTAKPEEDEDKKKREANLKQSTENAQLAAGKRAAQLQAADDYRKQNSKEKRAEMNPFTKDNLADSIGRVSIGRGEAEDVGRVIAEAIMMLLQLLFGVPAAAISDALKEKHGTTKNNIDKLGEEIEGMKAENQQDREKLNGLLAEIKSLRQKIKDETDPDAKAALTEEHDSKLEEVKALWAKITKDEAHILRKSQNKELAENKLLKWDAYKTYADYEKMPEGDAKKAKLEEFNAKMGAIKKEARQLNGHFARTKNALGIQDAKHEHETKQLAQKHQDEVRSNPLLKSIVGEPSTDVGLTTGKPAPQQPEVTNDQAATPPSAQPNTDAKTSDPKAQVTPVTLEDAQLKFEASEQRLQSLTFQALKQQEVVKQLEAIESPTTEQSQALEQERQKLTEMQQGLQDEKVTYQEAYAELETAKAAMQVAEVKEVGLDDVAEQAAPIMTPQRDSLETSGPSVVETVAKDQAPRPKPAASQTDEAADRPQVSDSGVVAGLTSENLGPTAEGIILTLTELAFGQVALAMGIQQEHLADALVGQMGTKDKAEFDHFKHGEAALTPQRETELDALPRIRESLGAEGVGGPQPDEKKSSLKDVAAKQAKQEDDKRLR